jgi:hypothetical protein
MMTSKTSWTGGKMQRQKKVKKFDVVQRREIPVFSKQIR